MIGPSSNSSFSNGSYGLPPSSKAAEAELISKATQTAIVAARSILMNGGSEDVALKTAKAAAESVLNPKASDNDSISGRSTLGVSSLGGAFGSKKRKAKRQAEVVASMALMSATSGHPGGGSIAGELYGKNIITVRHDEPSVLSGSITSGRRSITSGRPPKMPTPKSQVSRNNNYSFREHSQMEGIRDAVPNQEASPYDLSIRNRGSRLSSSSPMQNFTQRLRALSPTSNESSGLDREEDGETSTVNNADSNSLSQTSTMDSNVQSSVDASLRGRSESEDESDVDIESDEESDTIHVRDHLNEKRKTYKTIGAKRQEKEQWDLGEIILRPLALTMNIMSCGQIVSGEAAGDVDALEYKPNGTKRRSGRRTGRRTGRRRAGSPAFESRDDTFDYDCDDNRKKSSYRDQDFTSSYSGSFLSSASGITEGDSEGEIKVRSSIRETMESLVTKSKKKNRKGKSNGDGKRQISEKSAAKIDSSTANASNKKKALKRRSSFFKKKKCSV